MKAKKLEFIAFSWTLFESINLGDLLARLHTLLCLSFLLDPSIFADTQGGRYRQYVRFPRLATEYKRSW